MLFIRKHEGVIQNLGWYDRVIRVLIAAAMVVAPMYLASSNGLVSWHLLLMLLAVYPLITGIIGMDPLYSAIDLRSCDTSDRNRCGTFPFEVDTAMGRHPVPNSNIEHSLEHSHH